MKQKKVLIAFAIALSLLTLTPLASAVDPVVHQQYVDGTNEEIEIFFGGQTELAFPILHLSSETKEPWELSQINLMIEKTLGAIIEGAVFEDIFISVWTSTIDISGILIPSAKIAESIISGDDVPDENILGTDTTPEFRLNRILGLMTSVDIGPVGMTPPTISGDIIDITQPLVIKISSPNVTGPAYQLSGSDQNIHATIPGGTFPAIQNSGQGWFVISPENHEDFRFFYQLLGEGEEPTFTEKISSPACFALLIFFVLFAIIVIAFLVTRNNK